MYRDDGVVGAGSGGRRWCWFKSRKVDESLDAIRSCLIQLEDTIIFSHLERAQYRYNNDKYDPDAFSVDGFQGCSSFSLAQVTMKLSSIQVLTGQSGENDCYLMWHNHLNPDIKRFLLRQPEHQQFTISARCMIFVFSCDIEQANAATMLPIQFTLEKSGEQQGGLLFTLEKSGEQQGGLLIWVDYICV
ncbi:hypothetical protein L1987_43218 [Smallanthus sonchifolius]|uniref:Uncharacterized protein n=1 Tax=Smallanthus sonchifolius TaxID=185202 RepID=A0ACB9GKY3_9ASTR|nr:hypothetical protein L1987_43218 [Smallanthus sonchifolius]